MSQLIINLTNPEPNPLRPNPNVKINYMRTNMKLVYTVVGCLSNSHFGNLYCNTDVIQMVMVNPNPPSII